MGLFSRFKGGGQPSGAMIAPVGDFEGSPMQPAPAALRQGMFARWKAPDETGVSKFDRLNMLGASMRDDPRALAMAQEGLLAQQKTAMARQQLQARAAAQQSLGGLFGGGPQSSSAPIMPVGDFQGAAPRPIPQGGMPSISDPAVIQQIMAAAQAGVDVSPYLEVLKANKAPDPQVTFAPDGTAINSRDVSNVGRRFGNPANVNNTVVDLNDPNNLNRVVPAAPVNGAMPVYDNRGQVVDWTMPQGALRAIGAVAGAQEGGRAPYTPDNRTDPTGAPLYGTVADRFGGVPMRGQAPADAVRANTLAEAGAGAVVRAPQAMATATDILSTIDKLRSHPGRESGTGMAGILPPIPGTATYDFVTLNKQASGKVFLEAFASLKGGGAITEREGQAATEAMARMDRAQTKDGYLTALSDLEAVVKAGMGRMQQQAGSQAPDRPAGRPTAAQARAELARRRGGQ
jgi:hypothetical protein